MNKFAIIGCGDVSRYHAECISTSAKLVAVCDLNIEKAETLARQYNCKADSSIDYLLKEETDIDTVIICTPNGFHAEHVIKSLQAGKYVICESPLCLTSAAAWQIIETEKFSGKKLFVINASNYIPVLQDVKKMINDNVAGRICQFQLNCFSNKPTEYYKQWRGKKFPGGGLLYTEFSHCINAMLGLFGDIGELKGFVTNVAHENVIELEDNGAVTVKMQNDILGTINWSANAFDKLESSLTIIAEKGSLYIGGEYLDKLVNHHLQNPYPFQPGIFSKDHNSSAANYYKEIYTHLIKTSGNSDGYFSNSFDGLKTVETIERIYKAVNPL